MPVLHVETSVALTATQVTSLSLAALRVMPVAHRVALDGVYIRGTGPVLDTGTEDIVGDVDGGGAATASFESSIDGGHAFTISFADALDGGHAAVDGGGAATASFDSSVDGGGADPTFLAVLDGGTV